jgi:hypothetical protein
MNERATSAPVDRRLPRPDDPVVRPDLTVGAMTDRICAITLRERPYLWWWAAFVPSIALTLLLVAAVLYLFYAGIGIWGVNWPVMWGFAILSYVWWIAIASGGTIISALFFLMGAEWRDSINRIAESMMLFGAAAAGIYPILHLGRPWLFYWLFFYPNTMTLWPQFRSPLLWDFWALFTYVFASILFWYLGLLPDLASVRDRAASRTRQRVASGATCVQPMPSWPPSWRPWSSRFTASWASTSPVRRHQAGTRRSSLPSSFAAPCSRALPSCCSSSFP